MIDLDFGATRDLETVLEELYSPIPDGEYVFVITDAEVKASKDASKAPSLKVVLTLAEDNKKNVWKWFYLDTKNEVSMAYLKDFLEKVYNTTFEGSIQLDAKDMIGKHVVGITTIVPRNDDKDKMQNDIKTFAPVPF